ncbi:MAG: hypothetical protein ACI4MN_04040 [Candidatus Coproplasma sp.]
MYGCEFCVMDKKKLIEYCAITGEPTNGAVMCDFEFERCEHRSSAQAQEQNKHASEELIQTSIFGVDDEKPFKAN